LPPANTVLDPLLLKVASYAFTTLRPQLGVLRFSDGGALTVADVPGAARREAGTCGMQRQQSAGSTPHASLANSGHAGSAAARPAAPCDTPTPALPPLPRSGLVEGAHAGRGRGSAFLAHLAKARCLAMVVDLSGGTEGGLVAARPAAQVNVLQVMPV
jgi:hypothetical protein